MSVYDQAPRYLRGAHAEEAHQKNMAKADRKRQLQEARKQMKHTRTPQRSREAWNDGADDDDYVTEERIMPRTERDRRKAVEQAAARAAGAPPHAATVEPPTIDGLRGRVVEVSTGLCRVEVGDRTLLCRLRGKLTAEQSGFTNIVAVGDEVVVQPDTDESGVVEAVLPRRSTLSRPDVFRSHLRQLIVVNADQLLIVASWREPAIWLELIDRYLITAMRSGLPAVICVNKMDLAEDRAACAATLEPYRRLGCEILMTSAHTGEGIAELRALVAKKVSVLAGLSGVGKSTLLSAVQPGLHLRTAAVSTRKHEGRHTTTQATLLKLDDGGAVIDTPGIRELGLGGLRRQDLAEFFPEIDAVVSDCHFNNCSHVKEQGCAVVAAVADGMIAASRYQSYSAISANLPA